MSNVTKLPTPVHSYMTVAQALNVAKEAQLKDVLIIGYTDDEEIVHYSSELPRKDVLWMLESIKPYVMEEK